MDSENSDVSLDEDQQGKGERRVHNLLRHEDEHQDHHRIFLE